MEIRAKLSYLRIAPRKIRLLANMIRGKSVNEAQAILNFTIKRGSSPLLKLLNQAISNAKNASQEEKSNLYISKLMVDEGPRQKRWRARSRGSAGRIKKRTSHVVLYLKEIVKESKKKSKKKEVKKIDKDGKKEKVEKIEKIKKTTMPKFRQELKEQKPKKEQETRKIFRRKAF